MAKPKDPPRENVGRTLPIGEFPGFNDLPELQHGDHVLSEASVSFRSSTRFSVMRSGDVMAEVVVRCHQCGWNARATHQRSASKQDPHAFFTDKAVLRILWQAMNNFKTKVPPSCGEALIAYVMTS